MKRDARIVKSSDDGKRHIAIDEKNEEEILTFIKQNNLGKKFDLICRLILEGIRNTELFDRERINAKCNYVTAMKFKGKLNARIYCQQVKYNRKSIVIIAAELHERKKNQRNQSKEISLIIKVSSYDYQIKEA